MSEEDLIHSIVTSKSRLAVPSVGLVAVLTAAVIFYYWISGPAPALENFYAADISYTSCYYDKKSDYPKIVLESGDKKYKIYDNLWKISGDKPEDIVRELSKYPEAKVWLAAIDGTELRGIHAPTYTLDPSVGVAWEISNRKPMFWMMIGFFAGGIVLFALVLFSKPRN